MNIRNEPAAIIGAVEVLGIAVVTLLALIFDWDETTTVAVVGVVSAAIAALGAFVTRSKVTPTQVTLEE